MKRVTFKIAKTLKEVGYPQGETDKCFDSKGVLHYTSSTDAWLNHDVYIDAPIYLAVWLWLWREKKICINCNLDKYNLLPMWWCTNEDGINYNTPNFNSPEEAIIAAIEYLVENDLIK